MRCLSQIISTINTLEIISFCPSVSLVDRLHRGREVMEGPCDAVKLHGYD